MNRAPVDLVHRIFARWDLGSGTSGWLSDQTARFLRAAVGFRNVLVHGYAAVDPTIVRDILETRLGDIERFVAEISARLSAE